MARSDEGNGVVQWQACGKEVQWLPRWSRGHGISWPEMGVAEAMKAWVLVWTMERITRKRGSEACRWGCWPCYQVLVVETRVVGSEKVGKKKIKEKEEKKKEKEQGLWVGWQKFDEELFMKPLHTLRRRKKNRLCIWVNELSWRKWTKVERQCA